MDSPSTPPVLPPSLGLVEGDGVEYSGGVIEGPMAIAAPIAFPEGCFK